MALAKNMTHKWLWMNLLGLILRTWTIKWPRGCNCLLWARWYQTHQIRSLEGSAVFSRVKLFMSPWTVAHQAPLSKEFSRQEYWNGLPSPTPGYLPNRGIETVSLASSALAGRFITTAPPGKPKFRWTQQQSIIRRLVHLGSETGTARR